MFLEELERRGVEYELTDFPAEVFTAEGVARALNLQLSQVAKAMLVKASDGSYGIALVPGDRRLALARISTLLSGRKVEIARRQEVVAVTGLPVGAVTPLVLFTKPELHFFCDLKLAEEVKINISSGDLKIGLTLAPSDLVRVLSPIVAPISE